VTSKVDPDLPADYLTAYEAVDAAGISYRQLDYWANTGLVEPSIPGHGSGTARRFSPEDVEALRVAGDLTRYGVTTRALRRWDRRTRVRVLDAISVALDGEVDR